MNMLFGALLIVIVLAVLAIFLTAVLSGQSTTRESESFTGRQSQNVGQFGGSRHSWKDINS